MQTSDQKVFTKAQIAILLLSFASGFVLLFDLAPWLRGLENRAWQWWVAPDVSTPRLLLFAGSMVFFGLVWVGIGRKLTHAKRHPALLILLVGTLLVQFAMLAQFRLNPVSLQYEYVVSNQVSGYWSATNEIENWSEALRNYPAIMQTFTADPHPRSKPPGIVLSYVAIEQVLGQFPTLHNNLGDWARPHRCADFGLVYTSNLELANAVIIGLLTPLISAFAIWPAYGVAQRRWGVQAGWLAAGLIAILPGRLLFTPNLDTIYVFLTLAGLAAVDRGLHTKKTIWFLVGGVVLSAETYLSLVNAFAGITVGLFFIFSVENWHKPETWLHKPQRNWLIAFVVGCLSFWILYGLFYRVSPFAIVEAAGPARNDLQRDYAFWLGWNLVDYFVFVGLPLTILCAYASVKRRWLALLVAFWLVLLGLDVSGQIRAETGRIWLMLAPFPLIFSLGMVQHRRFATLFMASMLLTSFAMGWRWEVNPLEWPPQAERVVETQGPSNPSMNPLIFDDTIHLVDLAIDGNQGLTTTFTWHSPIQPQTPYTIFVHVLDENGEILAQSDSMPQANVLPMTCFAAGEFVTDIHTIDVSQLASGDYDVRYGLYDAVTGFRPIEPQIIQNIPINP